MSTSNLSDQEIQRIRQGLTDLGDAIFQLSRVEVPEPVIKDRSISGNKIHGGMITEFRSVGIRDDSTRLIVVVDDNGILTDNIDVETIVGGATVTGDLVVEGEVRARKLHVDELTADVRQERTSPLEFVANDSEGIDNKGLLWRGKDRTRQFVFKSSPDRLWSSEPIDIHRESFYSIGGVSVLNSNSLGSGITKSNLQQVGVLQNLTVSGNVEIDQFIFWNSGSMRLGFGTESPNGLISILQDRSELILDVNNNITTIGSYTTSDLNIVTDNIPRISINSTGKIVIGNDIETKVTVKGKLGINVNNPDSDLVTAGPVSFEGKRFEVGSEVPKTGSYKKGDVVWNIDPKPTGFVGWICVKEGTPGVWKTFGQISA